jgi:signal transduction histidine kinase
VSTASNVIHFPLAPTGDESNHAAAHRHVGDEFLAGPARPNHVVHFYEDEESLFDRVSQFLGAGLRAGDPLLVIATEGHRTAFRRRLERFGGEHAIESGQLVLRDAHETLSKFMVGNMPDPHLFRNMVSNVVVDAKRDRNQPLLRVYGEMVDVLWRGGNSDAALRLEELWNDAGQEHTFSLLCAYVMGNFYREPEASKFFTVCRNHTHIVPTESVARLKSLEKEIAHRKELEEALRESLRKRNQIEEELRASLRREQEARAEAEAGISFREVFVGMLSHDLRNPLNTILTAARLMAMRGEVVADGTRRLERLISSGVRMQRMIDQLLDLTRARLAGGIVVERTLQNIEPLVAKIVKEARAAHSACTVEYHVHGDCWASVDADRFEQVASNLIGNAVTHGDPEKPIRVELGGTALAVHLSVQNYGKPIDPAFIPCLFDPFTRSNQREGRSEGLGLGLYIVERIVSAHDGKIDVASSTDTGTLFEATIPRHGRERQPEGA